MKNRWLAHAVLATATIGLSTLLTSAQTTMSPSRDAGTVSEQTKPTAPAEEPTKPKESPSPTPTPSGLEGVAKQLQTLRSLLIDLAIWAFVIAIAGTLARQYWSEALILEPITVSESAAKQGYTSDAVTATILNYFQTIQREAQDNAEIEQLVTQLAHHPNLPDVQLPGTQFSLRTLVSTLSSLLGFGSRRVGGTLREDKSLLLRFSDGKSQVIRRSQGTIDDTLYDTALALAAETSPCYVASFLYDKNPAEAQRHALHCLSMAKTNEEKRSAYVVWAKILHQAGDNAAAIEKYERADQHDSKSPMLQIHWGNVLRSMAAATGDDARRKKYATQALEHLVKAHELDASGRSAALIHMDRGLVFYVQHQYADATKAYERALAVAKPGDRQIGLIYANLGNATRDREVDGRTETKQQKLQKAVDYYRQAIEACPESAYIYAGLSYALLLLGDSHGALRESELAMILDPRFTDAHLNAGKALLSLKRPQEALERFQRAKELPGAELDLAQALVDLKRFDEAIAIYQEAADRTKTSAAPRIGWARALRRQGELAKATAKLREAIDIEPDSASAHNDLGDALFEKDLEGARVEYEKAKHLDPSSPFPHAGLGRCLRALGKPVEAQAEFEIAISLGYPDPADLEATPPRVP